MIKIALDKYPFWLSSKIGPNIFLERLSKSLKNMDCKITNRFNPIYDIGLFAIKNKSIFNKPYVLRLDGIFIDKMNTISNSINENNKMFQDIDNSAGVIFVSNFSKKLAKKFYENIHKPSVVISNSVSLKEFKSFGPNKRSELKISDKDFVILASGSWRRHKRLEETITFFERIEKKINNIKLLIIGEVKNKNKNKNIIYAGNIHHHKLSEWYRTGNIYLHLAWIDHYANTHVEATACGLPSISSNNGGNIELIENCESGIVSKIDEEYNFEMVDFYNPPKPNYKILEEDFMKIYNNYNTFKKNIQTKNIDINFAASKYLDFLKEVKR